MHSIHQILDAKGREVFGVHPQSQVIEAIQVMADHGVGALVVLDDDQNLAGVVSERDYARKVILKGKSSRSTPVGEIMTSDVITVTEDDTVDKCLAIMTQHQIRHLPVVEGKKVVGVLAIGDLVRAKIDDQEHQIESMEQYIAGQA